MPRIPFILRPSSVKVPVLSKTMILIIALTFTFGGEVQKILLFLSLPIAKEIPKAIAGGKHGGTMDVSMLMLLSNTVSGFPVLFSSINGGITRMHPKTPMIDITPTQIKESL
jgi:hypothetical protein